MFCCTLLYVHSSIAIILMGKRELVALLNLSSWCLVMVEQLFLAVSRGCLRFVFVVFPDHTHLLFLNLDPWICRWTPYQLRYRAGSSVNTKVYVYSKPKVTLHFELPNISLLLLILTKLNIAMSCWYPPLSYSRKTTSAN